MQPSSVFSLQKRKREDELSLEGPRMHFRVKTTHGRRLAFSAALTAGCARLDRDGNLLILQADGRIVLVQSLLSLASPIELQLHRCSEKTLHLTAVHRALDVTYVASCSENGQLTISSTEEREVHTSSLQVEFEGDNERVTAICAAGAFYVLGTTSNNVYVVHREGSRYSTHLSIHCMVPRSNMLAELIQTGFKLLGLSSTAAVEPEKFVFKFIVIPNTSFLLKIGGNVSLWGDWNQQGREHILWETDLRQLIEDDILESFKCPSDSLVLHDAHLLPVVSSFSQALLVVLSTADNMLDASSKTLYMHVVDISLTVSVTSCTVTSRIIVDSMVSLPDRHATYEAMMPILLECSYRADQPRQSPWRLNVAWFSAVSKTLHAVCVDMAELTSTGGSIDLSSTVFEFDLELAGAVAAIGSVDGNEGLLVIDTGRRLENVVPVFLDYHSRLRAGEKSDKDLGDIVLQICRRQLRLSEGLLFHLKRRLHTLGTEAAENLVTKASLVIADHEHGRGQDLALEADSEQSLLLAHKSVKERFADHSALCDLMLRLTVSSSCYSKVVTVHQSVALCYGLSEATAELASRSKANGAEEDFLSLSYGAGLKIVELAMRIFRRDARVSEAVARAKGLSAAEICFSQCTTAKEVCVALASALPVSKLPPKGLRSPSSPGGEKLADVGGRLASLLAGAYGVVATFTTALSYPAQEACPGSSDVCAVVRSAEIRRSVLSVFTFLGDIVDSVVRELDARAKASDICNHFEQLGVRSNREVLRIKDLARLVLDGYAAEYAETPNDKNVVNAAEDAYEQAKRTLILPLIATGNLRTAFQLSSQYSFFHGLLLCFERTEDQLLARDFFALVRDKGDVTSTFARPETKEKVSLGAYSLSHLWSKQLLSQLLHVSGLLSPGTVYKFTADKPSAAWAVSIIRSKDFGRVATSACQHGVSLEHLTSSQTLLSISKLAAKISPPIQEVNSSIALEWLYVDILKQLVVMSPSEGFDEPKWRKHRPHALAKEVAASIHRLTYASKPGVDDKQICTQVYQLVLTTLRLLSADIDAQRNAIAANVESAADMFCVAALYESSLWIGAAESMVSLIASEVLDETIQKSLLFRILRGVEKANVEESLLPYRSALLIEAVAAKIGDQLEPRAIRIICACLSTAGNSST